MYITINNDQHDRYSMSTLSIAFKRLTLVVETVQTTKFQPLDNEQFVVLIAHFSST